MKNGLIFDFCFCLAAVVLLLCGLYVGEKILYGDELRHSGRVCLTVAVPSAFGGRLRVGDEVFDGVTKRRVGKIAAVEELQSEGTALYSIELDTKRTLHPSHPLRTKRLWFEYTVTEGWEASLVAAAVAPCVDEASG